MDCIDYRESGELSDIRIIVDGDEFNLHKFPLFVRSNYFKNTAAKTALKDQTDKLTIKLENFPGGSKVFALIADYCYNKEIQVDATNVIFVKCAAEYLEMNSNGKGGLCMFVDNILFDLLYVAKSKRNYKLILQLIEQSIKYKDIVERCKLNLRLLDAFIDYLSLSIKLTSAYNVKNNDFLSKTEAKIMNNLPLSWFVYLIKSRVHMGPYIGLLSSLVENYIDYNTNLNPNYRFEAEVENVEQQKPSPRPQQQQSTETLQQQQQNDHHESSQGLLQPLLQPLQIEIQNDNTTGAGGQANDTLSLIKTSSPAISPIVAQSTSMNLNSNSNDLLSIKNEDVNATSSQYMDVFIKSKNFSDHEKLDIIRSITHAFNETYSENQLSLNWLLIYMNALNTLNADDDLKSLFLKWIWYSFNNIKKTSDDLNMIPIEIMIQLANDISKRDENSNYNFEKFVSLSDQYLNELHKNKKLTPEIFTTIAKCVPPQRRHSFDNLTVVLLEMLQKDCFGMNQNKQQELLELIDFNKLNESTLDLCKNSDSIPPKYVTEAALALCAKLRKELDEQKALVKSLELKVYPAITKTSVQTATTSPKTLLNDLNLYKSKHYNLYDRTSLATPLLTKYKSSYQNTLKSSSSSNLLKTVNNNNSNHNNENKTKTQSSPSKPTPTATAATAKTTISTSTKRIGGSNDLIDYYNEIETSDEDGVSLNSSVRSNPVSSYYDDLLYSKDYYYSSYTPTYSTYRPIYQSSYYYDSLKF